MITPEKITIVNTINIIPGVSTGNSGILGDEVG